MKVTVDISENELREICEVTSEKKKGPAIRKLVMEALTMKRRAQIASKFISGEWGVDLEGWEEVREADRKDQERLESARRA